eukprot:301452-Chlamydomonas_euryale.AAC.1
MTHGTDLWPHARVCGSLQGMRLKASMQSIHADAITYMSMNDMQASTHMYEFDGLVIVLLGCACNSKMTTSFLATVGAAAMLRRPGKPAAGHGHRDHMDTYNQASASHTGSLMRGCVQQPLLHARLSKGCMAVCVSPIMGTMLCGTGCQWCDRHTLSNACMYVRAPQVSHTTQ